MAVNINCHRPMTICSVYLPPNRSVDVVELRQLVKQLPKLFMLLGDFNGHHTMWGCRDINPRGRIIEDFLSEENLCIFNDDLIPSCGSTHSSSMICFFLCLQWFLFGIFLYSLNCVIVQALQHVIRPVTYRCQEHRHLIISNILN